MSIPNGIKNLEGTCYMNATIQCFNCIEELSTHLLNLKSIPKNTTILGEYINILKGLRNNTIPCNISKFRLKMEKVNKLFRGHKGNDPSDLIINFLNSLEEDLKECGTYTLWFYDKIKNNEGLKEVYDFNIGKTIINDLFNYITEDELICGCLDNKYNYQTQQFMLLNVYRDDSIENYLNNNKNQYYSKLTCQNCRQNYLIKNKIKICPKYMIFVLNPIDKYLKYQISFNESLYLYEDNKKIKYIFTGMIVHLGSNSDSGHFVAYCRNLKYNNSFYKFNDSFVEEVDFRQIQKNSPYILFYKKTPGYEIKEKEIENLKYRISGILDIQLSYRNKKIYLYIDFTQKKINFKIESLLKNDKVTNDEINTVKNIIYNTNNNSSFFNLGDLDEFIRKFDLEIKNRLNYNS